MPEINSWSVNAASNNSAAPDGWPENTMTFGQVNDAGREVMAVIARWFGDINGSVAVAGTDTYTATLNADTGLTLYDGFLFTGDFANANTGAATINLTPDGGSAFGAKSIVKNGSAALVAGDIPAGAKVSMVYDGTNFQMLSPAGNTPSVITTRGDVIRGDSSGDPERLAIGADGTALMSDGTDAAWTGVHKQGKHTIWVPAAAMRPTVSNGCATLTDVETTAGRPDMQVLDFDATADEHAQFQIGFPKSWNEGTVTYQVFWTSTAADTDGVTWSLQGVSVADNATIDVAYGTAVTVDDANQSAAEEMLVSPESGAVTIASAAVDTTTFFRIFRDVSDANDTATEDARLIGVKIFFTTDAADDT